MQTIIAAIFVFLLVILIHELGHFTVAKLVGIKVNEFSIGMGPKIIQKTKGDTQYTIRALPIGGYVSMEGEDEDSEEDKSFNNASVYSRIAVIAAGAIMNFILAIIVFSIISYHIGSPTNIIGEVINDTPASEVGLEKGDIVKSINNNKISSWEDIVNSIEEAPGKLKITVERNNEEETFIAKTEKIEGDEIVGIMPKRIKSFKSSIKNGFKMTFTMLKAMFQFIGMVFKGEVKSGGVQGPVGVIGEINKAAQSGFYDVLFLLGLISVNLGFFNLIPIPALDGGRLFFLIIEMLRGKPIDPEKEAMIHFLGFIFLMGLMLFITYRDIISSSIFGG